MGVVLSRYDGTEFEHARIFSKPSLALTDAECSMTNQTSPFEYSVWENLPTVVLVEIYRYLPNRDKFSVSLTCRAWSRTFSRSEVWRNAKFHFNGRDNWRALKFPTSLAPKICHLAIYCQYARNLTWRKKRLSTSNLNTFLNRLVTFKACRLVSLEIIITGYRSETCPWLTYQSVLSLRELLSMQTRLKHLNLTRTNTWMELLTSIATSCGSNITALTMDDHFIAGRSLVADTFWQRFTNLTDLTVSRNYLSDFSLIALAVSGSLMRLAVVVNDYSYSPHASTDAWEKLTRSCPSLEARFCFNMVMRRAIWLDGTLVPGIPLVALKFHWSNGGDWNDFSNFIATLYQNSLRSLYVVFENQLDVPKDFLDDMIERCLHLEEISFTGGVENSLLSEQIIKSVQGSLDRQPASRLNRLTENGKEIKLCSTLPKL